MKKNKSVIIIGIISLILIITVILITIFILNKDNNKKQEEIKEIQKIDQMENYDYYLEENTTEYYKKLYNDLKETLNKEEVNNEEYAKIVSQLFVTDLFTLDNKITSNDIGGLQFVYTDFTDDFTNIAKTTLYSSVESNIYQDREQELPIVTNTIVSSLTKSTFTYNEKNYDSYEVSLTIEYQKDLDYPKEYNVTLIRNDKYIQVVASK